MALANQPAKAPATDLTEGLSGPAASPTASIMAGDGPIAIPQASLLFDAEFVRSGDDLTLAGHDGQELLIADYFGAGAPDLIAPNHAMLDGQTVTLLAGPQFPGQYAQAGGATQAAEPIGAVEALQGTVTAQRADGTTHELKVGDPVFESDVIATGPGSNVGMKLADGTLVTLQESGKLAINEFVYQADGTDNSALLNVIQGTFSLFAGQVAPTGDMQIKTPIATMGIRGTSILGVNVDAILGRLSLTQDPDGHVGFIEIFNNQNGNLFTVLRTVFEKITISESGLLSLTPKTPEELSIDKTLTELLHDFYQQVPQQGPDTSPQPQSGSSRFETPDIQEILFAPTPPQGGEELLLPQELLEQFLESLLEIQEIRDEIILALTESPSAGQVILDDQPEGSGGDTGTIEGGGTIVTTLPFDFGSSGSGSVGFAALDRQPVRSPGPDGNPVTADGQPVASGGVQLVYSWDAGSNTLFAMAGNEVIFTITVVPTTGAVEVKIIGAVDHLEQFGNGEFLSIDVPFTVQAANGQTATGALTVGISDDVPVAAGDVAIASETEDASAFNIAFVLDYSGSISDDQLAQQIAAVKSAGQAYFSTGALVLITVIAFGADADALSEEPFDNYEDFAAALDATLEGERPVDTTDTSFDAAIQATLDNFTAQEGEENRVFFLSDGNGTPLSGPTQKDWSDAVNDPEAPIDVTAIGIGDSINLQNLQQIDVDGNGAPVGVEGFDDLIAMLVKLQASGNVLTGEGNVNEGGADDFGADGLGAITSIVIDGDTYQYDAESGSIVTLPGGSGNGDGLYEQVLVDGYPPQQLQQGSAITIDTMQGGKFTFHFADDPQGGHSAGDWEYVAPSGESALPYEHIRYTVEDGDGDQSTSDLIIQIEPGEIDGVVFREDGPGVTGDAGSKEVLVGGEGADTFALNSFEVSDFIADYRKDEGDEIDLSALLKSYNDANGTSLSGEDFLANNVSYNSESGQLSVDSNGDSSFDSVVATLGNTPANVTIVVDDSPAPNPDANV